MKLNDMTLADIDAAAELNKEQYVKHYKGTAKQAFIEGACWAYEYLTEKKNNLPAWCTQAEKDCVITADLLQKNGWISNPENNFFMKQVEVNGIPIYFEYNLVNKALFYLDSLIPYPVEKLSLMKKIFDVFQVEVKWEV